MKAAPRTARTEWAGIRFTVNNTVYPLEAILTATYHYIDNFHVFLDRKDANRILISLSPKRKMAGGRLKAIQGEFHNRMLLEALRLKVSRENRKTRQLLYEVAMAAAQRPSVATPIQPATGAAGLPEFIEAAEKQKHLMEKTGNSGSIDDPLGIGVPMKSGTRKGRTYKDRARGKKL